MINEFDRALQSIPSNTYTHSLLYKQDLGYKTADICCLELLNKFHTRDHPRFCIYYYTRHSHRNLLACKDLYSLCVSTLAKAAKVVALCKGHHISLVGPLTLSLSPFPLYPFTRSLSFSLSSPFFSSLQRAPLGKGTVQYHMHYEV